CPHDVAAVERAVSRQPQGRDLAPVDAQRELNRALGRRGPSLLAGRQDLRTRPEQPLRLAPRLLEDLRSRGGLRDRPHRLDERLEEARLGRELALGLAVPLPLADEKQQERERAARRDRERQPSPREPAL